MVVPGAGCCTSALEGPCDLIVTRNGKDFAAIEGCTPSAAYKRIHLIRQAMAARLYAA